MNDMGAKMIGRALTANKSLTTLNLCYNKITCEGAGFIAKVLLETYHLSEVIEYLGAVSHFVSKL